MVIRYVIRYVIRLVNTNHIFPNYQRCYFKDLIPGYSGIPHVQTHPATEISRNWLVL